MPERPHYRRQAHTSNFTYVSPCVKYMIFLLNFIFWLFGGLLIGIGLYAFVDKWQLTGSIKLENVYDFILNISLVMVLMGGVIFIVSFAGCVGALRENTCLLKFYSILLLFFFILEMGIALCGFMSPHVLQSMLEDHFTDKIIHNYRDDPDLQNFIDFAQQEFRCCGLSSEGYMDWSKNEYFNCSSPSVEHCGVPFSCCINATDISSRLVNIMCGYGVQTLSVAEASKKVWSSGCIDEILDWFRRNCYTISGIIICVALLQALVVYCSFSLSDQINAQRKSWYDDDRRRGLLDSIEYRFPSQMNPRESQRNSIKERFYILRY